jgi:hypothetical protein
MIRLVWLLAVVVIAAASAHFAYLHFATGLSAAADRPELAWLERKLSLSPAQYAQVQALHETWTPQLAALRTQLQQERQAVRVTGNTAACIAVEDECKTCTVTFIRQVAALLTPLQRQKYLALVQECLPPEAKGSQSGTPTQGVPGERPAGR